MGGAGTMIAMIQSLRENRAMLKRIKPFYKQRQHDIDNLLSRKQTGAQFKKASPEYMEQLRRNLRKQSRVEKIVIYSFLILAIIAVPIVVLLFMK